MGNFGKILCLAAISLLPFSTQAQKIHESASLETSHLWRGLEVGNGLIFNNDVSLSDNNDHFKIGLWGGMATDGDYKEADVYVNYNNSGFNLAVWDLWNFSDGIPGNGKYIPPSRSGHQLRLRRESRLPAHALVGNAPRRT